MRDDETTCGCPARALTRVAARLLVPFAMALAACTERAPADAGATSDATSSDTVADDHDSSSASTSAIDETGTPTTDDGPPPDLPPSPTSECDAMIDVVAALARTDALDEEAWIVNQFLQAVTWGDGGFPIVEDDRTCFLYLGRTGESLSIAGDFNGWTPGELVLQPADTTLGLYTAIVTMPRAQAVGLYKIVRDDIEFFADPLARRFGWDEFGQYSRLAPDPDRSHYERWPDFAEGIADLDPRDITVFVPPGGLDADALPLLVMHDGQNLFAPDAIFGGWRVGETIDLEIAAGTIAPLFVVGIDNTPDRMEEYTHVPDDLGGMLVGGRAETYASFIVDGVLPFVAARYPVSTAREDVAVLGSSLGGLVSLYIAWSHPDAFGSAGSMSGTVGWGSFGGGGPTILDLFEREAPADLAIYLDSGGGPGFGCPDGDSDNYCDNVALADGLRALGWTDESDLFYRFAANAPHNEAAWADRLAPALREWFPGAP